MWRHTSVVEELVRLRSLSVSLEGRKVLEGIDLTVGKGESIAVVGPNGSGKTTLLRTIATLVRPSGGEGTVLGSGLERPAGRETRRRIGLISHLPGLLDDLTLRENLVHFCRISGHAESRCDRALDAVGLAKAGERMVSEASFGMKRRAEIAWLLISRPDLLLLDEARSGLDTDAEELIDVIARRTIEGDGAVIAVSHHERGFGSGFRRVHRLHAGSLENAE